MDKINLKGSIMKNILVMSNKPKYVVEDVYRYGVKTSGKHLSKRKIKEYLLEQFPVNMRKSKINEEEARTMYKKACSKFIED
jgi:hypothetical protein